MFLTNIFIFTFITLTAGKDYYELLGVSKDADNREIRRAFKKLAVSLHPDKNMDDPNAHEVFVKLTRAYEVLKDPQLRKHYDVHGEEQTDSSWKNSQYHSYTYYRDHFGIYDDDPEIITLSSTDFESYVINSDKQWFVNYYSPLCSHCHELAPTWRKLAVELKDIVMFAAVNCEEEWNLCRQQNIRAYPSLILYPSVERFTGSRNREDLNRFILDRAEVDIRHVRSTDDWTKLTEKSDYPSWLLLLCNSNVLPDCPHGDMRTKLAAILNGLVGVAVVDCTSLDVCSELVQDLSSVVYWSKTQHGISSFTLKSEYPVEMAKEVFDFMPDLIQLNTESFNDMITKLELGSQTPWLVYFHIGSYDELDNEVKKLAPLLMPEISVGRVNCGRFQSICSDVSVSRYPSFAVFKPGGGHEFHHGTVSVYSIVQFARESAAATNLRTLTQHLFPQLVMAQDGSTAWFVDFYAPWCPPCLRLLPELRKASRTFDTVRFGTVDCTIHSALCKQHNIQAYPTTILFNHSQPTQFFRGEHSASSIVDFIQDILNPSVIKLTEETFYTTLGRKSPDSVWIVDYFMPWCGPCQQLAPQWRKLAKMVSDIPNVYVAEVNCETENSLCRQQGVQSYPSIRLYPLRSSGLNTVALYNGYHRDARSLRQWLFSFLPSSVVELTPDSFSQVLQGKDYWLIDFYAPWCGHCHAFEPEFKTVAQKLDGKVKTGKVNCEQYRSLCQLAGVSAYPTLQLYYPGTNNYRGTEITSQTAASIVSFVEHVLPHKKTTVHDEF